MVSYWVKLLEKKEIALGTWAFYFDKPADFTFSAGQFTTMHVNISNGKRDSRDMTIASSPLDEELCIVTKIGEQRSQFKQALFELPIGQTVTLSKPAGGFILRKESTPYIFLAGGIGITPFYSMLKFAWQTDMMIPLRLFVSFSSQEESIFYEELQRMQKNSLHVVYSLTNPSNGWCGETGRISEKMIEKYIQDIANTIFMIAGPVEMVDEMQSMLLEMGVVQENIRIDYFTGY